MMAEHFSSREDSISVVVAHRDPLVREGLASILRSERDFVVSVAAVTHDQGYPISLTADVVVADYETALYFFDANRSRCSPLQTGLPRVMVVSHRDRESEIRYALDLGVRGYLLLGCDLEEMIRGVRALYRGQRHLDQCAAQRVVESLNSESLSLREDDVLRLISLGCVNKKIASELNISLGTVKAHVKAILAKLGAKTRTEAAAIAQRRGLTLSPTRRLGHARVPVSQLQ